MPNHEAVVGGAPISSEAAPVVPTPTRVEPPTVPPESITAFYDVISKLEETYKPIPPKPGKKLAPSDRATQATEVAASMVSLAAGSNFAGIVLYSAALGPAFTYFRYLADKFVRGAKANTGDRFNKLNAHRQKGWGEHLISGIWKKIWNFPEMGKELFNGVKGLASNYLLEFPRKLGNKIILDREEIKELLAHQSDEAMKKLTGDEAARKLPIAMSGLIFQYGKGDTALNLTSKKNPKNKNEKTESERVEDLIHAGNMANPLFMKAVTEYKGSNKKAYAEKLLRNSVREAQWLDFLADMKAMVAASVGTALPVVGIATIAALYGSGLFHGADALGNSAATTLNQTQATLNQNGFQLHKYLVENVPKAITWVNTSLHQVVRIMLQPK